MAKVKAKMGRPRIEIAKEEFEYLCKMMCTEEEIAGFHKCSVDTIERYCEREYNSTFAEVYKQLSSDGKISLRRNQFKLAEKSPAMAIWLGKQYLGQKDEQIVELNRNIDDTVKAMDEYFGNKEANT